MEENRLYVGNLPDNVTMDKLRVPFAKHGTVTNVHIAVDRQSGRNLGYAFVTMSTDAEARAAVSELDGAMFEERPLRVNNANADRDDSGNRARNRQEQRAREKEAKLAVRITSQFREARNMCYELDCRGMTVSIRIFPVDHTEQEWRIEATTATPPSKIVSSPSPTRSAALEEISRMWAEESSATQVDWVAITAALSTVRAI